MYLTSRFSTCLGFVAQVISQALKSFDIDIVPIRAEAMAAAREHPEREAGFICWLQSHWFTVRPIGDSWWNLDSMLPAPNRVRLENARVVRKLSFISNETHSALLRVAAQRAVFLTHAPFSYIRRSLTSTLGCFWIRCKRMATRCLWSDPRGSCREEEVCRLTTAETCPPTIRCCMYPLSILQHVDVSR